MEEPRDRLVRYLQDAYAAEVGIAEMLEGLMNDVDNDSIRMAFNEHISMTRNQADRLAMRLQALGSDASGSKGFFNTIMAKMSELMHGAHDDYDKVTQNLIKAYATEHLERGMYELLIAYATAMGDMETASLGRQIQAEEEQTAQRLYPMISMCAANTFQAAERDVA